MPNKKYLLIIALSFLAHTFPCKYVYANENHGYLEEEKFSAITTIEKDVSIRFSALKTKRPFQYLFNKGYPPKLYFVDTPGLKYGEIAIIDMSDPQFESEIFQIKSVSGCNGKLEGNIYTTAPIKSHCSIKVTYEPSSLNKIKVSFLILVIIGFLMAAIEFRYIQKINYPKYIKNPNFKNKQRHVLLLIMICLIVFFSLLSIISIPFTIKEIRRVYKIPAWGIFILYIQLFSTLAYCAAILFWKYWGIWVFLLVSFIGFCYFLFFEFGTFHLIGVIVEVALFIFAINLKKNGIKGLHQLE